MENIFSFSFITFFELETYIWWRKKKEGGTVSVSVTTVRAHCTRRLYTVDLATAFIATYRLSLSLSLTHSSRDSI